MATIAISGKAGAITGPSGLAEVTRWSCDVEYELLDATSMESNGYAEYVLGLQGASGTLDAIGTPPALGSVGTLVLKTKTTGGRSITGAALIEKVSYTSAVDGRVEFGAAYKLKGTVTLGTT
jgi:hypothetical protein